MRRRPSCISEKLAHHGEPDDRIGVRRQRVRPRLRHDGEVGESSVGVPAGVLRLEAEVLAPGTALVARAAGASQPRDAEPVADDES